jgi:hypothetical protein
MGEASPGVPEADWPGCVARFHAERAGITEDVLEHSRDDQRRTPYDWAAQAFGGALIGRMSASSARVLDLACGRAPMSSRVSGHDDVGMDLSAAELARAPARELPVAVPDAGRLPLPGGTFVATVPHDRRMPTRDRLRDGRLCGVPAPPRAQLPQLVGKGAAPPRTSAAARYAPKAGWAPADPGR